MNKEDFNQADAIQKSINALEMQKGSLLRLKKYSANLRVHYEITGFSTFIVQPSDQLMAQAFGTGIPEWVFDRMVEDIEQQLRGLYTQFSTI